MFAAKPVKPAVVLRVSLEASAPVKPAEVDSRARYVVPGRFEPAPQLKSNVLAPAETTAADTGRKAGEIVMVEAVAEKAEREPPNPAARTRR
ncbi:MAG: hypothetical protein FD126_558 [Elusimicrobia bacterium]|nr:MAG: hypothetical protein FD126_558 [Elusimicrobiota bacterium]